MSNYSFNYSFNITGNCDVVVQDISQNVEKLNDNIRKSAGCGTASKASCSR